MTVAGQQPKALTAEDPGDAEECKNQKTKGSIPPRVLRGEHFRCCEGHQPTEAWGMSSVDYTIGGIRRWRSSSASRAGVPTSSQ